MRLYETGFELNQLGINCAEGQLSVNGATISNTYARTGAYSLRSYGTGAGSYSILYNIVSPTSGAQVFVNLWFYVVALPHASTKLIFLGKAGGAGVKWDESARLSSTGHVEFLVAGTKQATSTGIVSLNTWTNLQISLKIDGNNSIHECKIFGETLSYSFNEPDTQAVSYCYIGKEVADSTYDVYFDDIVANDDTGAYENGYPDINERVFYLFPIGENVINGWTGGGGGTSNLYDAVNNVPPAGSSSETDSTNIKNVVASAIDDCDFVCQTYDNYGIGSGYTIHVVRSIVRHGEHASANTKAGAVSVVSNPEQGAEDSFDFGLDAGGHGNEIGAWRTTYGTPQYNPTVIYTTNPVVRVGKRTASTDQVCVDFIGIIVTAAPPPEPRSHTFTMTGGLELGGDMSTPHGKSLSMSGGMVLGGNNSLARGKSLQMSGGLELGGNIDTARGKSLSMSGGVELGGSNSFARGKTLPMSGGVVLGGDIGHARGRAMQMSGGVVFGGENTFSFIMGAVLKSFVTKLADLKSYAMKRAFNKSEVRKSVLLRSEVSKSVKFFQKATKEE
jgi:hypothetical protein